MQRGGSHRTTRAEQVRAFLIAYYGTQQRGSLAEPLPTITTHDRFTLVTVRGQPHVIEDIGLRLLTPRELFRAQSLGLPLEICFEARNAALTLLAL